LETTALLCESGAKHLRYHAPWHRWIWRESVPDSTNPDTLRQGNVAMKWFLILCFIPLSASSQDIRLLECARIAFFEPACAPEVPVRPTPPPPPPAPLFSPETVAKDTPPLMLTLLEAPTLDNARAFLDWQRHRLQRIAEVQQLLKMLTHAPQPNEKE
jgi:hypothetical protein